MNSSILIPAEVINRYAYKNELPVEETILIFDKLVKFLESASQKSSVPNKQIDSAWHEFILHTKLYFEYCQKKFGRFIHHIPTSSIDSSIDCESDCDAGVTGPNKSKNQEDKADCETCGAEIEN